jgi:hypothetical protein
MKLRGLRTLDDRWAMLRIGQADLQVYLIDLSQLLVAKSVRPITYQPKLRLPFNFTVEVLDYVCVSTMLENWLVAFNSGGNPGMRRRQAPIDPAERKGSDVIQIHYIESGHNRLTFYDRRQVAIWASGPAAALCRLQIYADIYEEDEIGDFISIYRPAEEWASWCVARRTHSIIVWETKHGKDLGSFPNMIAALHAILPLICDPLPSSRHVGNR